MNRKIEVKIDMPEFKGLSEALSYLILWNMTSYDKLTISHSFMSDTREDLTAYYRNSVNGKSYVIGAVWDKEKQKYSFHS